MLYTNTQNQVLTFDSLYIIEITYVNSTSIGKERSVMVNPSLTR